MLLELTCLSVHVHGFCAEDTLSTAQPFVTKPGVMMRHHELQCHVTRLGCYLQGHGHSDGLYCLNVTVSTGSSKLIILLHLTVVWL